MTKDRIGILYGVGVGPGDPELLTLKAVNVIKSCEVIGIPAREREICTAYRIAEQAVPEISEKEFVAVPIPMTSEEKVLERAYGAGRDRIADCLKAGKSVAFLNLGDPTVYGTYMPLHRLVERDGFRAELVNGIPSFCAVAAQLGLPLGKGDEEIHVLPGCYKMLDQGADGGCDEAAYGREIRRSFMEQVLDRYDGSVVIMKSAGKLDAVKKALGQLETEGRIIGGAVTNCGMEGQRIYKSIRDIDEQAGYFTTIILKKQNDTHMQAEIKPSEDEYGAIRYQKSE